MRADREIFAFHGMCDFLPGRRLIETSPGYSDEAMRPSVRFALLPLVSSQLSACSTIVPPAATTQADELRVVWLIFLGAGLFVYAAVVVPIGWTLWRHRRPRDPQQFRRNTPLEITLTVIPVIMVGGLFAVTYPVENRLEHIGASRPNLVVDVTAFRWSWRFAYPEQGVALTGTPEREPRLVLPVDETVRINLRSSDVNHAFWVPAFWFKRDAIPGLNNHFDLTPRKLGSFRGACAEFCGLSHALMSFTVEVVPRAQFEGELRRAAARARGNTAT